MATLERGAGQSRLPVRNLKVNQLGYHPSEKKIFLYSRNSGNPKGRKFEIVRADTRSIAFTGIPGKGITDRDSGDRVFNGDFTSLTAPGRYEVRIGPEESYPFEISDDKHRRLLYLAMRSYHLQRCGTAIRDAVSGISHGACHERDGFAENEPLGPLSDLTGGWHDAGDYGKYIATAAVTVAQLLLMYEQSPETFDRFSLDIPKTETDGHLSDILAEIRYELDWMLKMQDAEDGGVFHKVNSHEFPSLDTAPEADRKLRYRYSKGTADTAYFAGALAIAARAYERADPAYAVRLKNAALGAGNFLMRTDGEILVPSNGRTGTYFTASVRTHLYWAYAELFRLTGLAQYLEAAERYREDFLLNVSWQNVSFLGAYALLSSPGTPVTLHRELTDRLFRQTEIIQERVAVNGYRVALDRSEYVWASVKTALAYGESLLLARRFIPGSDFTEEARRQLDYVLGMNPLGKVFITGIGTDSVRNPHHRVAMALETTVPGLLVGGPNDRAEDGRYPKNLGPRGYVDSTEAPSCNEPAIDYNAPLVFVAGYLLMMEEKNLGSG